MGVPFGSLLFVVAATGQRALQVLLVLGELLLFVLPAEKPGVLVSPPPRKQLPGRDGKTQGVC